MSCLIAGSETGEPSTGMRRLEYELFADYFQFYIQDETADGNLCDSWSHEAVDRMLAVAPGTVGVGTVRNTTVPVIVEIFETEPDLDAEAWDHVTECSFDVPGGRIVIAGCTDYFPEAARVEVSPGTYRARISYGSLDTVSETGLDGADRYRVQLWQSTRIEPHVIKQHTVAR
jgi:hypothetical protein